MGLFDRIKKAFTGKDDSKKDEELEKKSQEAQATDQNEESDKTSSESTETKVTDNDAGTEEKSAESTIQSHEESEPSNGPEDSNEEDEPETKETEINEEIQQAEPESETKEADTTKSDVEAEPAAQDVQAEITTQEDESESESDSEPKTDSNEDSKENSEEQTSTEQAETESKDDVKEYDEGLKKSRNSFSARFNRFLANFRSVDEDFFDDLEELLIESDVGYETAMRISDELREEVKLENAKKRSDVSNVIVKKLVDMYGEEGKNEDNTLSFSQDKTPTVFLFVGVNGAGKTTTIGKLAHRYQQEGKKVLLAAGDTFRAGAIEQLQEWGKRVDVPVQASKAHTDPASVVYDAVQRAVNEDFDILLVDTAGRLQNKEGLMRELEKIKRVITRELPNAPQEVLLVLDGSTGQNALSQAKQFNETTDVSGIVLTKLDGSSQGGIVLAIRNELHIPVKLVGLGEQMDDLRDFDPEKFIYGLFKELIVGSSDK
ncbi:signal recognition particle-docking protein FtsY [Companilactobacillus sp. HBUAS56257]|uniref:signal recognition particle-docking protein FtsY n=1 Tax=Companilactobacillus sp. HBUAS56257 TaxID=3109360 RepID=UPI002FF20AC6